MQGGCLKEEGSLFVSVVSIQTTAKKLPRMITSSTEERLVVSWCFRGTGVGDGRGGVVLPVEKVEWSWTRERVD